MGNDTKKLPTAAERGLTSLPAALEWLRKEGDLIETETEVNPDLEIKTVKLMTDGDPYCEILFIEKEPK